MARLKYTPRRTYTPKTPAGRRRPKKRVTIKEKRAAGATALQPKPEVKVEAVKDKEIPIRPGKPSEVAALSRKDFRSVDERLTAESQKLATEKEKARIGAITVAEARARPPAVTKPTPYVGPEYVPTPYKPGTRPEEVTYAEPEARRRMEPQITTIHETVGEIIDVSAKRFKEGIAIAEGKEVKVKITPVKEPEKYVTRDVSEFITEKTEDYRRAIESAEAQRAIRVGIKAPTFLLPTPEIKERDPAVRFITGVLQAPAMVPDIAASLLLGAEHAIRTKGEVYKELPLAAGVMIGGMKHEVTVDPFRFAGEMVALPLISKALPTAKVKPVEPTIKVKAKPTEIIPESIKKVDIVREAELRQMEALAEQRVLREIKPVEVKKVSETIIARQMEALAEQRVLREIKPITEVKKPPEIRKVQDTVQMELRNIRKTMEAEVLEIKVAKEPFFEKYKEPKTFEEETAASLQRIKFYEKAAKQMEEDALTEYIPIKERYIPENLRYMLPRYPKVTPKSIKESVSQLEDIISMQVKEPPKKYPIKPFKEYTPEVPVRIAVAEKPPRITLAEAPSPKKIRGLEELMEYETAKRLGIIEEPITKRKKLDLEGLIDYETAKKMGIVTKPAKKRRRIAVPIPERVEKPIPSIREVPAISIEPIDITKIFEGIKPVPTPKIEPVPRPYPEPKPYPEPRKYVAPPIPKLEEIPPLPKLKPRLEEKRKKVAVTDKRRTPGYAWDLANPIASLEQLMGGGRQAPRTSKKKTSTPRRRK